MEEASLNRTFPSEEELVHIKQMRENIEPFLGDLCRDDDVFGDLRLCRFLRGHGPKNAEGVVLSFIEWRKEKNVDAIRASVIGKPANEILFGGRVEALKYMRTNNAAGFTKDGDRIQITRMGRSNPAKLIDVFDGDDELLEKTAIGHMEFMAHQVNELSRKTKRLVKIYSIMDAEGLGMGHLTKSGMKFSRQMSKIGQNYYCEHAGRINILNAPIMFKTIFAVVKPLISKRSLAKFRIVGSNFDFLLDDIAKETLVPLYGGTRSELWGVYPLVGEIDERKPCASTSISARSTSELTCKVASANCVVEWRIDLGGHEMDFQVQWKKKKKKKGQEQTITTTTAKNKNNNNNNNNNNNDDDDDVDDDNSNACEDTAVDLVPLRAVSETQLGKYTSDSAGVLVVTIHNNARLFSHEVKSQFDVQPLEEN